MEILLKRDMKEIRKKVRKSKTKFEGMESENLSQDMFWDTHCISRRETRQNMCIILTKGILILRRDYNTTGLILP